MDFSQYIQKIQARARYSDYIAQEQRISQGCGSNSSYAFRPLDSGVRTDILIGEFNTSAAETSTILGSPIAKCSSNTPPPPPIPSTTIVADLAGITFDGSQYFLSTFSFASASTITVAFINADVSISNVSHIDFRRDTLPNLTPTDTFTISTPTYTPFTQQVTYGPGNIYSQIYANESFGLTSSSVITFVGANFLSNIGFNIN